MLSIVTLFFRFGWYSISFCYSWNFIRNTDTIIINSGNFVIQNFLSTANTFVRREKSESTTWNVQKVVLMAVHSTTFKNQMKSLYMARSMIAYLRVVLKLAAILKKAFVSLQNSYRVKLLECNVGNNEMNR